MLTDVTDVLEGRVLERGLNYEKGPLILGPVRGPVGWVQDVAIGETEAVVRMCGGHLTGGGLKF